jgi:phospholipase C
MVRPKLLILLVLLVCVAGLIFSMNGCGASSGKLTTPPPPGKIEHVVILFQENRTPDNLFQDQALIAKGADIASSGVNSKGATIQLTPIDLGTTGSNPQNYDLSHSHASFLGMYDSGKMDGADKIGCSPAINCPPNAHPNPQFTYVLPSDVQPYFALAEQYTFGDRMFQTNQGPSMPAHQYIISGTSWTGSGTAGNFFEAENPELTLGGVNASGDNAGCTSPATETVLMIDVTNPDPASNETTKLYPCFDHATIIDLLDAQKLSWKYYSNVKVCGVPGPCPSGIWIGPNAIQHLCQPNVAPPNGTVCTGPDWVNNVLPGPQVLTDIANGQLPTVSWVIPDGKESDHPVGNTGEGPSWVASIVNAIGQSQYWNNTAIIITWDDWGGFFDHVAPPVSGTNSYEMGFRVPLIVVSPYAKAGYISHVQHDFGSILKFIESTFGLSTIGPNAGFADSRSDDLSDCFDFTQTPLTFTHIQSKYDAAHFLNDKRPAVDPDDD